MEFCCTNNCHVDVCSGLCQIGCIAREIVSAVREINPNTKSSCCILTRPSEIVIICRLNTSLGDTFIHFPYASRSHLNQIPLGSITLWCFNEGSFSSTSELQVSIYVYLQSDFIGCPWVQRPIAYLPSHRKSSSSVHLRDNFTPDNAVWIVWINRTTRW